MAWHCKPTGNYKIVHNITAQTDIRQVVTPQGIENATHIANIWHNNYGWSYNAIAGALSAIHRESGYNPWAWQSDNIPTRASVFNRVALQGYGLVQWTPSLYVYSDYNWKYINNPASVSILGYGPNFSDVEGSRFDGEAQTRFMGTVGIRGGWRNPPKSTYPITFDEWCVSTLDAGWLGVAWVANFERPASEEATAPYIRAGAALWYQYLTNMPTHRYKWWIYQKGRKLPWQS